MDNIIKNQICQVNYALTNIISAYGSWAKKNGLSYNSLIIIYLMEDIKSCTQKQICDTLQIPKSTIHSILTDFIKKGYIILEFEGDNKKEKIVKLTKQGEEFFFEILSRLHIVEERAMQKLGTDMCQQLVNSNIKFSEFINQEVENE